MQDVAWDMKWPKVDRRAQSTMEFSFAAIVLVILIYGLVQSVRWVVMDAAQRRYLDDRGLASGASSAAEQLNPQAQRVYFPDLEYRGTFHSHH